MANKHLWDGKEGCCVREGELERIEMKINTLDIRSVRSVQQKAEILTESTSIMRLDTRQSSHESHSLSFLFRYIPDTTIPTSDTYRLCIIHFRITKAIDSQALSE